MDKSKLISWSIPAFFLIAAVVLVMAIANHTSDVTNENRTYNRFIACGLSVPADNRTQEKIDACWEMAQQDTGTEVKRYDLKEIE